MTGNRFARNRLVLGIAALALGLATLSPIGANAAEDDAALDMYTADVTNVPSLFARSPDWAVTFDMDPEMARQTRRRIFDQLVKDKMAMGGFHFPFPALGTLEASGSGYQFKAMA